MKDVKDLGYCACLDREGGFRWQGVVVGVAVNEGGRTVFTIEEMSWLDDSLTGKRFDVIADYALLCIFSNRRSFDLFMRRTYEIEDKLATAEMVAILDQMQATTKH